MCNKQFVLNNFLNDIVNIDDILDKLPLMLADAYEYCFNIKNDFNSDEVGKNLIHLLKTYGIAYFRRVSFNRFQLVSKMLSDDSEYKYISLEVFIYKDGVLVHQYLTCEEDEYPGAYLYDTSKVAKGRQDTVFIKF